MAWNRTENHDRLEKEMRANIEKAAAAKLPNVITFSGNRRGMGDEEGKANTIAGLNRVKKYAEDAGVTICLELLNSKMDHKDYMCDHTAWGVEVVQGGGVTAGETALRHLPHADHGRRRDPHHPREHFATSATSIPGGVPGRHEIDENQELHWRTIAQAIADLKFEGYFAHEFVPVRDPMTSLKEAFVRCSV